ncbi:MAG: hypothetical protein WC069_03375 [Candidatus Shapirobacteria bacterium]
MKQHYENNNKEVIKTSERALVELANWWGGRLVAKNEELKSEPFYSGISGKHGLNYPFYILATRHCNNESEQQSIAKLGGVIGVPGNYSIATGEYASKQILLSTGIGAEGYGQPHDGLTHIYLQPAGYELNELCGRYFRARDAGSLANAFSPAEDMDTKGLAFDIQCIIDAPWETLSVNLTNENGQKMLRSELEGKLPISLNKEGFQFKLRILENKHLLAII